MASVNKVSMLVVCGIGHGHKDVERKVQALRVEKKGIGWGGDDFEEAQHPVLVFAPRDRGLETGSKPPCNILLSEFLKRLHGGLYCVSGILGKSRFSMILLVMGTYRHWWWIEIVRWYSCWAMFVGDTDGDKIR